MELFAPHCPPEPAETGKDESPRRTTTRDSGTMQRLALMQEVPNRAKRDARVRAVDARIERERAARALAALAVRREAALAWIGVHHADQLPARVHGAGGRDGRFGGN